MGMYTECYINCKLVENLPQDVIDVLKYLFDNPFDEIDGKYKIDEPSTLPDHKLFRTMRWHLIGKGGSFYHIPFPTSKLSLELEGQSFESYYLTSRSDLKNYEGEIELFFDWIMPYIDNHDGEFIGYSRYEEDDVPVLIFARNNK